jgi:ketosteroid isomerase-like protein
VTADALRDAHAILDAIQAAVDARDADALISLFDDSAILVGTGGDARGSEGLRRYLTAVATQEASLRWEWREVVPFHQDVGSIGFAAFGDIVVSDGEGERRAPIRLTAFAVETSTGRRLRQFHGSIPSDF